MTPSDWVARHTATPKAEQPGVEPLPLSAIRAGLAVIGMGSTEPREIRILRNKKPVTSGVFDDLDEAARTVHAESFSGSTVGCYVTLNPTTLPVTNTLRPGQATNDSDIRRRTRLVVDIDPEKLVEQGSKSVPATDTERLAAIERADAVREFLVGGGWDEPGWLETPNGVQLWWKIDLPASDGGLVQQVLWALNHRFGDDRAKVDCTLYNPSRIARVPGTPGRKGEDSVARPWRCSGPMMGELGFVPQGELERLVQVIGAPEAPATQPANLILDNNPSEVTKQLIWLVEWLQKYDVPNVGPFRDWLEGGKIAVIRPCPWEPDHDHGAAFVGVLPDGRFTAGCRGDRCKGKKWHQFRSLIERPVNQTGSLAGYGTEKLFSQG